MKGKRMMGKEKTLQDLNLEDDFLFAKVMVDEEVCKSLLGKIFNKEVKAVRILNEQKGGFATPLGNPLVPFGDCFAI